jgi:anti-sigma regulatory factor (Ser/Thr protein kinase)
MKNEVLGKTKRSRMIRRYLLNSVKADYQQMIHDGQEIFKVSRQTIHAHLKALVNMGYLVAHGNTKARTYDFGPKRSHIQKFALENLRESDVYYKDFSFIFKGLPSEIEDICHYGFTEMLNNAIDHSGGGFVYVNVSRDENFIEMSISDDGEGIFNHIARVMELSDPRESILELSKGKLTTDPENHTGQGIFFTSRTFDTFYIYCGDLIFSHNQKTNDYLLHDDSERDGTSVFMKIDLDSDRTLESVFDAFTGTEDENFAFNTTIVPVKLVLYEGEKLVSRSQAKRILNRVEKFNNVILDFTDVGSIGQAFADEVFRVFARRNPQIDIQPVNTTDNIDRMIRAAKNNPD